MTQATTVGLDLAKHVFQAHGIDATGRVVIRKRITRAEVLPFFSKMPRCLIGMEACGTAHHWARELAALGHEVRLMPPSYVKPYVKRSKNDAADAEAICEAVQRPTMRFVPIKTIEQQSVLMLHRARDLLIRQRTMLANALRSHFAELGIIVAQGTANLLKLTGMIEDESDTRIPPIARLTLRAIARQISALRTQVRALDERIVAWARSDAASRRLISIPGVGPITATAIAVTVTDPSCFHSGRQFAAWLGLVPRQNSSGGKDRLGGICKRGDRYIRRLLVVGAHAVIRYARTKGAVAAPWINSLLDRRSTLVVAVALANKTARIAWAVLARGEWYRPKASASV
jgi:transposase